LAATVLSSRDHRNQNPICFAPPLHLPLTDASRLASRFVYARATEKAEFKIAVYPTYSGSRLSFASGWVSHCGSGAKVHLSHGLRSAGEASEELGANQEFDDSSGPGRRPTGAKLLAADSRWHGDRQRQRLSGRPAAGPDFRKLHLTTFPSPVWR